MKATILIVSRNRAGHLRETLASLSRVKISEGLEMELLVVDNGSSDDTASVVRSQAGHGYVVRYVLEPRIGKSHGLNRGIDESTGDVILFTDDDVRFPVNWVCGMCGPIVDGRSDAVAGGVRIAPFLLKPWMTRIHRSWLASTEWLTPDFSKGLVGANMAVSRGVLKRVPRFDPELGGGALGNFEDVLFGSQVVEAGFRIHDGLDVCVEHHFDASRIKREAWLSLAKQNGRSRAYVGHHWDHWPRRYAGLKVVREALRLSLWRATGHDQIAEEGCAEKELKLVYALGLARGHLWESRRPRNYEFRGLVKLF